MENLELGKQLNHLAVTHEGPGQLLSSGVAAAATGREVLLVLFSTPTDDSTDFIPASLQCLLTEHGKLGPSWPLVLGGKGSLEWKMPVPRAPEITQAWGLPTTKDLSSQLINHLGSSISLACPALLAPWSFQSLLELVPFTPCRTPVLFRPLSSGCGSLGTSQAPSPDSTWLFQKHKRKATLFLQIRVCSAPPWITSLLLQLPKG